MVTKKKPVSLHKNLPGSSRGLNPTQSNSRRDLRNGSRDKSKAVSRTKKDSKNSKEKIIKSQRNALKSANHNPILSSNSKRSPSKAKSLKKSKVDVDKKTKKKQKNLYTDDEDIFPQNFLQGLTEKAFEKLPKFKYDLLSFILKNRIIKDAQIDELYQNLLEKFPNQEDNIKTVLFEIVSSLDS